MQESTKNKSAMNAVLGLKKETVVNCCKKVKKYGIVECANFNSEKQIIISGEKCAVDRASEILTNMRGTKIYKLPISIASHCSLMYKSARRLHYILEKISICTPRIPVIHNFDNNSYESPTCIRSVLKKQLYFPIKWHNLIEKMSEHRINTFIECGTDKVLTSISKKIELSSLGKTFKISNN